MDKKTILGTFIAGVMVAGVWLGLEFFNINRIVPIGASTGLSLEESWQRISFPSSEHKNDRENFPMYCGEMRAQRVNYFGVSAQDPHFMLSATNMAGPPLLTVDGK